MSGLTGCASSAGGAYAIFLWVCIAYCIYHVVSYFRYRNK